MRRYTSEELLELAAGYALGATTEEETAAVEAALAESPELRAEVASFQDVALQLAHARRVAPSDGLRDRLLDRVRATPQSDGRTPPAAMPPRPQAPPPIVSGPLASESSAPEARVVPIGDAPSAAARRRAVRPWAWAIGLAASLLLAAALGVENARLRRALDDSGARLAAARAEADKRHQQLETLLEAEKDLYVAQMRSDDTVSGPGIQFFWNAKQHVAMAHAFRLRPAPAGRVYQLWLIRDGKPIPSTVFNSDPDGHALIENVAVPESTTGVTQVLLTEEPAGGSPQPTTKPFIGGSLTKT
jgi:anti-sigma-K factor RskA